MQPALSPFDGLGKVLATVNEQLETAKKSYTFEFARFNLIDSEHFKRTDLYYDACSLHAIYECDLDGRKYDVCIKALS